MLAVIIELAMCALIPIGTALAADTVPPSAPGGFKAVIVGQGPGVTLSWTAASDASGIKGYRVDRSLDQAHWETLSSTIAALTYQDTSSGFGLHYFYRLNATDAAGNTSPWTTTDIVIPDVNQSKAGSGEITVTLPDGTTTVTLPEGAAAVVMSCSVSQVGDSPQQYATNRLKVIAGPYQLSCQTPVGSVVTTFAKPATWNMVLKGKLSNFKNPAAYTVDSGGHVQPVKGSTYDEKSQTLSAALDPGQIVLVGAVKPSGLPLNLIFIILVLFGLVAGVILLVLYHRKKLDYDEYLRAKYYEI